MEGNLGAPGRIKKAREFKYILAKGRRVKGDYFDLYLSPKPQFSGNRLGVTLRGKSGSAVVRNRSKRLLKEVFRLHQDRIPAGIDLIVAVTKDLSKMKLREVETIFSEMIARSGSFAKS
jgi:ribonuclease P protein component